MYFSISHLTTQIATQLQALITNLYSANHLKSTKSYWGHNNQLVKHGEKLFKKSSAHDKKRIYLTANMIEILSVWAPFSRSYHKESKRTNPRHLEDPSERLI